MASYVDRLMEIRVETCGIHGYGTAPHIDRGNLYVVSNRRGEMSMP